MRSLAVSFVHTLDFDAFFLSAAVMLEIGRGRFDSEFGELEEAR